MTNDTVEFIPWVTKHPGLIRYSSPETGVQLAARVAREAKTVIGDTKFSKPMIEFSLIRMIFVLYVLFDGMFCVMTGSIPLFGSRLYVRALGYSLWQMT
jgi:hypothetical protein